MIHVFSGTKMVLGLKIILNQSVISWLSRTNIVVISATPTFKIPKVIWSPGTGI